jgi:hypothetical protein
MDEFLSQAAFSRARGVSRKQVTVWKQTGLLVMCGKLVNVTKSESLIDARPEKFLGGVTNRRPTASPRRKTYKVRKLEPEDIIEAELDKLLPVAASWTHAEATRKKEIALALTRQLEYDLKAANVVEVSRIAETVAAEYSVVRDRLLQLPGKVADKVCGLDRYSAERVLRAEVHEALAALSVHGGQDDRSKA